MYSNHTNDRLALSDHNNLSIEDTSDPRRVIHWDKTFTGSGSNEVLIGFRKLDDMAKVAKKFTRWQYLKSMVWLNSLAVCLTRPRGVTSSDGDMCHAELMIQVRKGEWVRFSINKKQLVSFDEETGDPVFEWGTVHATIMSERESEWRNKYCFLQVELRNRENVQSMFEFLAAQTRAPFNYYGYIFNNFFWCARFGTSYYNQQLCHTQGKWYCTEIIHAAMQCGALSEQESRDFTNNIMRHDDNTWQYSVLHTPCNKTNPNSMHRDLKNCCNVARTMAPNSGSCSTISLGKTLI